MKQIFLLIAVVLMTGGCKEMPTSDINNINAHYDRDAVDEDAIAQIDEDVIIDDVISDDVAETELEQEAEPLDEDVMPDLNEIESDDDLVDVQPETAEVELDSGDFDVAEIDIIDEDTATLDEDMVEDSSDINDTQSDITDVDLTQPDTVDADIVEDDHDLIATDDDVSTSLVKAWTKQWGDTVATYGYSVATDSNNNIFVTGRTSGVLDGNAFQGGADIFLTKWNVDGSKAWTKAWGTASSDFGYSVAVDGNGNIFVTGYTAGDLDGNTNAGDDDIFLTKWNANGTKSWTKQWGSSLEDRGLAVVSNSAGDIYVAGYTTGALDGNANLCTAACGSSPNDVHDYFLTKWNADGTKAWTKQWGTSGWDQVNGVAIDGIGNIFVTGSTTGALDGNTKVGNFDIFLTKLTDGGTRVWTKQWGTTNADMGNSMAINSFGDVFITGETHGDLDGNTNTGAIDIFLTKWTADGTKAWTKQWGTAENDYGNSVAVDAAGNSYVAGYTYAGIDGNINAGSSDIFLTKWTSDGLASLTKQWGNSSSDYGYSVALDSLGDIFVTGTTGASLDGGVYVDGFDVFLTKWLAE